MPFQCIRCHADIDRNFKACPHCGEPITDFLRRYLEEPIDGKYKIVERLGAGGMGEVYKVEHVFLRSTRVIKVIRPQISESADAHERFLREAQLATKIQHPNVATLHDFSELPDGSHYMVWEFIEGENLAQVLRYRGPLKPAEGLGLAVQALAGLDAIHRAGIIHRDISPENLMITPGGQVKIIDLGVAKSEEGDYAVTRTGIFVGKLRYASPEQLGFLPEGERIDARADLYSMAVVVLEMLTGKPPFEASTPHQYILQYSDQNVRPLDLTNVPGGSELQDVLRRALEHDRSKRFPTAHDFGEALDRIAAKAKTLTDDDTLRLTPPSGSTIRTALAPPPTVRTPIPQAGTVRTPRPQAPAPPPPQEPAAPTVIEPQPSRSSSATAIIVVVILLVAFAAVLAAGYAAWRLWPRKQPPAAAVVTNTIAAPSSTATTASATTTEPAPQPLAAASEVTVTPPQQQPPATTTAVEPPTPAPAAKKPVRVADSEPAPQPKHVAPATPQPADEQEAADTSASPHVFTEGGMSSRNDEAISFAREKLHGVTRVSLDARGDSDLIKQLGQLLQKLNVSVVDDAPVRIRFYGAITHQGFGRKTRVAEATILRNGRPVFQYELKPEPYRVGDNPAEAFARVLSDLFGQ